MLNRRGHYPRINIAASKARSHRRRAIADNSEAFNRHRPSILIVDDHPDVISSLTRRLRLARFVVSDPCEDLAALVRALHRSPPSIVLLDIMLRRDNSLDHLRRLRRLAPGTSFIIYTGYDDAGLLAHALREGARGFVTKLFPEEILPAIESALCGDIYIARDLRHYLERSRWLTGGASLNNDDRCLLDLLVSGVVQTDIARKLGVSKRTIERRARRLALTLGIPRQRYHVSWTAYHVFRGDQDPPALPAVE